MFEVTVLGDIASAHYLRGYEGPCKELHGHTWKIAVVVASENLDAIGMVVDFRILKKELKAFLKSLDHVCLNDLEYFKELNPTTENIAQYIYRNFSKVISPIKIKKVKVWESETSNVTYYE